MSLIRYPLATLAFLLAVAEASAEGNRLSDEDQQLLIAVIDANEAALAAASTGEMKVETTERASGKVRTLEAHVIWDHDKALFDYRYRLTNAQEANQDKSGHEHSGKLLDTPRLLVDFQKSRGKAFRSIDRYKSTHHVYNVLPQASWLSYNFELPLREVLTADESFDYGERNVWLERSRNTISLVLDHPRSPGTFRVDFSTDKGGLIRSVRHSGAGGPRYHADYKWAEADGIWYPQRLRMYSRMGGDFGSSPRFEMKISEFQPLIDVPPATFAESSLGVDETVEVVTYRKGTRPVVRKAKSVSLEKKMRELGESLSGRGFASGDR